MTGAHWLPAMLIGVDKLGYIKKSSVPNKGTLRSEPDTWYAPDPMGEGKMIDRAPLYMDPGGTPLQLTRKLPGRANLSLFLDWGSSESDPNGVQNLPVITDAFDQPILYYVANAHGRPTNMVTEDRDWENRYESADPQEVGPAYYFHQDNQPFTGKSAAEADRGWDFGTLGSTGHWIADSGKNMLPAVFLSGEPLNRLTFARYIIDRKIYADMVAKKAGPGTPDPPVNTPLRPVNADTYLLISAGVDGRYGTTDDVSNLPPWPAE